MTGKFIVETFVVEIKWWGIYVYRNRFSIYSATQDTNKSIVLLLLS
jgi:hypothetical protein